MLGLKLNHVSKRGHWQQPAIPSEAKVAQFTDAYMGLLASISVHPMVTFSHFKQNDAYNSQTWNIGIRRSWCFFKLEIPYEFQRQIEEWATKL